MFEQTEHILLSENIETLPKSNERAIDMKPFNEQLDIRTYLKKSMRTVDGLAWLATCVASIFCLLDILIGTSIIPLRDASRPSKAATLLLFSPLLIFLLLVWVRQFPLKSMIMPWIGAALCVFAFLLINF